MVSLRATGGPTEYTITAGIAADLGDGTDVSISVTGKHSLTGKRTQFVAVKGTAEWTLTLEDETVFVRVTRLDNGGCATLTLADIEDSKITNADLAGTYTGTWTQSIVDHYVGYDSHRQYHGGSPAQTVTYIFSFEKVD